MNTQKLARWLKRIRSGSSERREDGLGSKILSEAFEAMGVKPERLTVDVLIAKGEALEGIYIIPDEQMLYHTEGHARRALKPGQTLYRLDVYRLE